MRCYEVIRGAMRIWERGAVRKLILRGADTRGEKLCCGRGENVLPYAWREAMSVCMKWHSWSCSDTSARSYSWSRIDTSALMCSWSDRHECYDVLVVLTDTSAMMCSWS